MLVAFTKDQDFNGADQSKKRQYLYENRRTPQVATHSMTFIPFESTSH
jgi:hypothetical protein